MRLFGPLIVENGLIDDKPYQQRRTVRAIIINDQHQLLMAYSEHFDDYTFPGGGVEASESETEALKRELKEEFGALDVDIIMPCGMTKELRYGVQKSNQVYLQTSSYYVCSIHTFGKPELNHRELNHGIEARWISIDQAIEHNAKVINDDVHQQKGLKTVLMREQMVLNKLKEKNACVNLKL